MTVADLARELVAIPSHDDPTAAGDAIEDWLRRATDAAVTRDEVGNVLARRGFGPSLALVGHHDVVPPDASQLDGDACPIPSIKHLLKTAVETGWLSSSTDGK